MQKSKSSNIVLTVILTALLSAFSADVFAQAEGPPEPGGQQLQAGTRDLDRDRIRDQLRTRIDSAPGLTEQERARMRDNLDACLTLDVPAANLGAVFPDESTRRQLSAGLMLRLQERVIVATREGVAVGPVLAKAQEGRTKSVPEPALEQACRRMENHVRAANRVMNGLAQAGIDTPGEPVQQRRMQGEVAQHMWRGLNEPDYDGLRDRARERRRYGDCDAGDVVAAGEVATRLLEGGVERGRAVDFAGTALQEGYRYSEMRQIQIMVAARHQRGEPMDELVRGLEHCVGVGMGAGEMYGYMIRHGWMGPGDMYGPGGHQPADPKGHGGGHGGGQGGGQDGGEGGGQGGGQSGGQGGNGGGNSN